MDASIGQACELQVYHDQNLEIFNFYFIFRQTHLNQKLISVQLLLRNLMVMVKVVEH